ncbi:hypothetical protein L3X38_025125 [Prunus dulcis]|uniref:Uncharacterized protein n=1 Tax=Prunus dulcis TaxID=3755 RepID=A0AAD4W309_PRUDU|nr:hypothetical protein L3X38_025125 [Prunus dulcis]
MVRLGFWVWKGQSLDFGVFGPFEDELASAWFDDDLTSAFLGENERNERVKLQFGVFPAMRICLLVLLWFLSLVLENSSFYRHWRSNRWSKLLMWTVETVDDLYHFGKPKRRCRIAV